jgi:hypothetical protein
MTARLIRSSSRSPELVVDVVLDEDAPRRGALLSGGEERPGVRNLDGSVKVGVGHHDQCVLAPQLQLHPLTGGRRAIADMPAHLDRAGEGDRAHLGPGEQLGPGLGAATDHHVEHPGGQPGVDQAASEVDRAHGRLLGGLEHDGVARHEGGRQLPRRYRHREVPRRDESDDADRPAHRVHLAVGGGLPVELAAREPSVSREVPQRQRHPRSFGARFPQRLAGLARHVVRDLVRTLERQLGRGGQYRRTLRATTRRPVREGGSCGFGRGSDVGPTRVGEVTQEVGRRGGAATLVRPAAAGRHPFAADQVVCPSRWRA